MMIVGDLIIDKVSPKPSNAGEEERLVIKVGALIDLTRSSGFRLPRGTSCTSTDVQRLPSCDTQVMVMSPEAMPVAPEMAKLSAACKEADNVDATAASSRLRRPARPKTKETVSMVCSPGWFGGGLSGGVRGGDAGCSAIAMKSGGVGGGTIVTVQSM